MATATAPAPATATATATALCVSVEIGTTPIGSTLGRWISEAGCPGWLCSLDLGAACRRSQAPPRSARRPTPG